MDILDFLKKLKKRVSEWPNYQILNENKPYNMPVYRTNPPTNYNYSYDLSREGEAMNQLNIPQPVIDETMRNLEERMYMIERSKDIPRGLSFEQWLNYTYPRGLGRIALPGIVYEVNGQYLNPLQYRYLQYLRGTAVPVRSVSIP
ncbi:MAG: hypothetical protein QXV73_05310 [Candidatus Micrarchaeia archaeon]